MIELALLAAAAAPQDLKTFSDWVVGCDNGRHCQAVALMPEEDYEGTTMVVRRGPRASDTPTIAININSGAPAQRIAVDGRPLAARIANGEAAEIAGSDAVAAIDALRNGTSMTVMDAAGKVIGRPSLKGMSAALLYIDEQQRRLGTVTALVRKGSRPASAVPAPPALPVIVSPKPPPGVWPLKLTVADVARELKSLECDASETSAETTYARLDAKTSLALLPAPCGNGAYNYYSYALLIDNAGKVRPASFEVSGGMGEDNDNSLVNADWDEKKRELTTYAKGRGLGDCGAINAYAWDGRTFRLKRMEVMNECRGSVDYIRTWQAVVR